MFHSQSEKTSDSLRTGPVVSGYLPVITCPLELARRLLWRDTRELIKHGGTGNEETNRGNGYARDGHGALRNELRPTRSVSPAQHRATNFGYTEHSTAQRGSAGCTATEFSLPGFARCNADDARFVFQWNRREG